MPDKAKDRSLESGFTLVELLVVIGIIAILFSLSTINLGHVQTGVSVASTTNTLLADLKNQQLLAMVGNEGSLSAQQPQGIYIQSGSYTLFAGSSYNSSDPNNYSVSVGPNTITTTFPSGQVLFEVGDGAVTGYTSGDNTITVSGYGGTSQTITVDRYGATSVN